MKKKKIQSQIKGILEPIEGISTSELQSRYIIAINEKDYQEAILASFLMYLHGQARGGADSRDILELVQTTVGIALEVPKNTKRAVVKKPLPPGPYCSFCGKGKGEIKKMIAGPGNIFICNECITVLVRIIKTPEKPKKAMPSRNCASGFKDRKSN
jgi:hypothetical protein